MNPIARVILPYVRMVGHAIGVGVLFGLLCVFMFAWAYGMGWLLYGS